MGKGRSGDRDFLSGQVTTLVLTKVTNLVLGPQTESSITRVTKHLRDLHDS